MFFRRMTLLRPPESREDPPDGDSQGRRDKLTTYLSAHRYERLKRKRPSEEQEARIAQEEMQMKRQLLQRMEETEQEFSANMSRLTGTVERLTNSIVDGFAMMQQSMSPVLPDEQPSIGAHPCNATCHVTEPIYQPLSLALIIMRSEQAVE